MRAARPWLVLAIAIACRLIFFALYHDGPHVQAGTLLRHVNIARSLLAGHGFQNEPFARGVLAESGEALLSPCEWPPLEPANLAKPVPSDTVGYAVLLAGVWRATGTCSFVPIQILQLLLDSLIALVLVGLVRDLTGREGRAWAVGLLYAVFLPSARMSVNPHREIWAVIGVVVCLALLVRFARGARWPTVLLAGVVFGLTAWLRPNVMPLVAGLPLALLLHPHLRRGRVLASALVLAATVGLVFWAPFVAYNQRTYGQPIAMIQGLGRWEGYGEFPNPYGAEKTDGEAVRWVREQGHDLQTGSLEWDRVLLERVREIDAQDPMLKYRNALRRLPQFFASGFSDVFSFPPRYQRNAYLAAQPGRTMLTYVRDHPFVTFARFGLAAAFWTVALLGVVLCLRSWRSVVALALQPAYAILLCSLMHFENRNVVVGMWGALYFVVVAAEWPARRAWAALQSAQRGEAAPTAQS